MEDEGWRAQQVVLRVARCSDLARVSELVEQFAHDGVLEVGDRTVEGREALLQFFGGDSASASSDETAPERSKHVVTNSLVQRDGEQLVVTSYFQVLRSWGLANWGRYHDRLIRAGDTWRIAYRRVQVDGHLARPAPPGDTPAGS